MRAQFIALIAHLIAARRLVIELREPATARTRDAREFRELEPDVRSPLRDATSPKGEVNSLGTD